jgi:hypothetical protein
LYSYFNICFGCAYCNSRLSQHKVKLITIVLVIYITHNTKVAFANENVLTIKIRTQSLPKFDLAATAENGTKGSTRTKK